VSNKRFFRGVARKGQPLVGSAHYIAESDCTKSIRKCDRNCEWPHCSRQMYFFNSKERADQKEKELKLLGHTVVHEEDGHDE